MYIQASGTDPNTGVLFTQPEDRLGRADARLVSIINKINRELKGQGVQSDYFHETVYNKSPIAILRFPMSDKSVVSRIARTASFAVTEK